MQIKRENMMLLVSLTLATIVAGLANAAELVKAEVDFADPKADRLVHDYPVKLDLTYAEGVEFDFQCDDFAPFQQFNFYFKSGEGWYALTMNPEERTGLQRIVIRKRDVKWKEGEVAGWHDISAVRIFGYRGNAMKASFAAGGFTAFNELPPKADERRLLWCHSPWGLGWNDANWEDSLKMIKEAGFTDILVSIAWANGACYKSEVLPPSPHFIYRKIDAFDACLSACRKRGIKFHVWMVCFNMSTHCNQKVKDSLAAAGRTQVDATGKENRSWLCPTHPENAEQIVNALVELAKKGADGVHLDYARYPDGNFCHCARCKSLATGAESWDLFRAENISRIVQSASQAIRRDFPEVEISAAVRNTIGDSSIRAVGQDWHTWCRRGWLDFVCPMDYFPLAASFRVAIERQKGEVAGVKLYPGIGDINLWPDPARDTSRVVSHIKAVREAGLGGFCFFDFSTRMLKAFKELK